jgi:hypothetical protein
MSSDRSATTLQEAFQEETEHYERALCIALTLPTAVQRGQDIETQLQEIMAHLTDVVRIEENIADSKRRWLQSLTTQTPPPPSSPGNQELEAYRTRLVRLIQELREQFGKTEQEASLRQSHLLPALESLLRGQQMQRAYGAVVNQKPRSGG